MEITIKCYHLIGLASSHQRIDLLQAEYIDGKWPIFLEPSFLHSEFSNSLTNSVSSTLFSFTQVYTCLI
jgi:hypothetical protein